MVNNVPQWKWKYLNTKLTPTLEACMASEKLMNLTEPWECFFFCVFLLFVLDVILLNGI